MKIPLLPVHILLTSTLQQREQALKEQARQLNNKVTTNLLNYNAHLENLIKVLDQDRHSFDYKFKNGTRAIS